MGFIIRQKWVYLVILYLISISKLSATVIVVTSGQSLNAAISNVLSDTILVKSGTYAEVNISNRKFTSMRPLVILGENPGQVTIKRTDISGGTAFKIVNCSYIVVKNLVIEGGMWGCYIQQSDHIIFRNNEVLNTGQEGMHINNRSRFIDIIDNHIHDSGKYNSQWGELIYIGTGAITQTPIPDSTKYVWIENNHLHHSGNGEAVNIKAECSHITIRNNKVHDIIPGEEYEPGKIQYNMAAIAVDDAQTSLNYNYAKSESRDIWIEGNGVYNISPGYSNWGNGIMFSSVGVNVVNNNVHDCSNRGIYSNNFAGLNLPCYVYNNTVQNCNPSTYFGFPVLATDPGNNPNTAQNWFSAITTGIQTLQNHEYQIQTYYSGLLSGNIHCNLRFPVDDPPQKVLVADLAGRIVYNSKNSNSSDLIIPVNKGGIYLINIVFKTGKVLKNKVLVH